MISFSYLKAALVLLLTFLVTAFIMLMLFGVLTGGMFKNPPPGALEFLFVWAVLFGGGCSKFFASWLLYDKDDHAELQVLGGMRVGDIWQASATGKGATWPFAKLSASRETLRLQTPFGNYAWERTDPRLRIQKTGLLPGQWKIGAEDAASSNSIIFSTWPWSAKALEGELKTLGYDLRS